MSIAHDVLVSYATEDTNKATEIRDALENRGFQCWMAPRDVRAGEDYEQEIVSAVENTRSVVVVFSRHANASRHVHREIVLADNESKTVFPIRIENTSPTGRMKFQLTNRQRIDYFDDKQRAIEIIHLRLVALGARPKKENSDGVVKPVPSPVPAADDDAVVQSNEGSRRFLPPVLNPAYLLFDWRGRIGRRSFFFGGAFLVMSMVAIILLMMLSLLGPAIMMAGGFSGLDNDLYELLERVLTLADGIVVLVFISVLCLAYVFGLFALWAKRLHDLDQSAWWICAPIAATALQFVLNLVPWNGGTSQQVSSAVGKFILDWEAQSGVILFTLWLLFWPGRMASNRFGFTPSFRKDWKPFDIIAQRASARSEFDIPFVILSFSGRIGLKGMSTGVLLAVWLVLLGLDVSYGITRGSLNVLDAFCTNGYSCLSVLAPVSIYVLAAFVLASVLTKRLHDLSFSGWFLTLAPFLFLLIYAISALLHISDGFDGAATVLLTIVAAATAALFVLPGKTDFNLYGPPPGFRADALRAQAGGGRP